MTDINENQHHSRPSRITLLIALGVVLGIGVIANWAEISAFAHIPQIKHALGRVDTYRSHNMMAASVTTAR